MADMFAPLVAQLKANPKTIVFTEGNDPRILEAASKLLAEGVLKVVMVGNEAECKAAAAAGNFDISAAEIIDPENYAVINQTVCIFAHFEEVCFFFCRNAWTSTVRTFTVYKL